jgi:predicted AAA+ superfamily ATPase
MITLKRKIDDVLAEWKDKQDRLPLIVKGARQVGKTFSILEFANKNYRNVITINFLLQKQYKSIFNDGYEVDHIIKNISLLDPKAKFEAEKTLIFFDELQACPDCATSLKSFKQDGRFDVICSGSLMGINYQEIESNSVGYKEDYEMYSLDFEEFLWAKGYSKGQIENIYSHIIDLEPFSELELNTWLSIFSDYMITGGMPAIVRLYCEQGNFSGVLPMQKQLLLDYEEDITRYAVGLDKGRIKNVYDHISVFLAKENKKFMITKVSSGARTREYAGTVEWLSDAGIVNVCYCLDPPELPLRGNYNPTDFKLYYADTGLLIASLDEENSGRSSCKQKFCTYKGAILRTS